MYFTKLSIIIVSGFALNYRFLFLCCKQLFILCNFIELLCFIYQVFD